MTKHLIKRIKTSMCILNGTGGLADTFLSFGIATLLMPIYNIGLGIDVFSSKMYDVGDAFRFWEKGGSAVATELDALKKRLDPLAT